MSKFKVTAFASLVLILAINSCEDSTWERQELQQISDYIKSLGDTAYTLTPSGLYYIELMAGTGKSPVDNDTVYFKYQAKFLDNVTWDTNDPVNVPYMHKMGTDTGPVITGIDEGLRLMKSGGKGKFLTPSKLAYGFEGVWQYVPGYTPLLWVIELDSVKSGSGR
jgi:FKBP-type peptidyl-prolyl cis-trans isomerase